MKLDYCGTNPLGQFWGRSASVSNVKSLSLRRKIRERKVVQPLWDPVCWDPLPGVTVTRAWKRADAEQVFWVPHVSVEGLALLRRKCSLGISVSKGAGTPCPSCRVQPSGLGMQAAPVAVWALPRRHWTHPRGTQTPVHGSWMGDSSCLSIGLGLPAANHQGVPPCKTPSPFTLVLSGRARGSRYITGTSHPPPCGLLCGWKGPQFLLCKLLLVRSWRSAVHVAVSL